MRNRLVAPTFEQMLSEIIDCYPVTSAQTLILFCAWIHLIVAPKTPSIRKKKQFRSLQTKQTVTLLERQWARSPKHAASYDAWQVETKEA